MAIDIFNEALEQCLDEEEAYAKVEAERGLTGVTHLIDFGTNFPARYNLEKLLGSTVVDRCLRKLRGERAALKKLENFMRS